VSRHVGGAPLVAAMEASGDGWSANGGAQGDGRLERGRGGDSRDRGRETKTMSAVAQMLQ
jgi:hypothetical protein